MNRTPIPRWSDILPHLMIILAGFGMIALGVGLMEKEFGFIWAGSFAFIIFLMVAGVSYYVRRSVRRG